MFSPIRCRGLTERVAALGRSQPSLSRSLAPLEARLGNPLFQPGRRPLPPTEPGLLLAEEDLQRHAWIATPPGNPLYQDLQQVRAASGAEKFRVSYSGGSLAAVMAMLAGSDSLTILPNSVVFTLRRQYPVAALPIKIAHPDRNPGLLSRDQPTLSPAALKPCRPPFAPACHWPV